MVRSKVRSTLKRVVSIVTGIPTLELPMNVQVERTNRYAKRVPTHTLELKMPPTW